MELKDHLRKKAERKIFAFYISDLQHQKDFQFTTQELAIFNTVNKTMIHLYANALDKGGNFKAGRLWVDIIAETRLVIDLAKNLVPDISLKRVEDIEIACAIALDWVLCDY